ncbi:MAG: type 4a pilus biogenesis protein PilO, partial [Nevskiales bacterium]
MNANINFQQYVDQLRKIDQNNPGSWPRWIQVMAILLLCAVVIYLGYRFVIQPKREELDQAKQEETRLRTDFETKQKKVAALDAYRTQLEEMQQSFGAMLRQLPNKSEVANLLNDISQTRLAAGLEEELFQPQGEQAKEFYAELPINMQIIGGYHQMGAFASGIASLPRIVTLSNLQLAPMDANKIGV